MSDVTYRNHHDQILAVGQLLDWSHQGFAKQAAKGFETAISKLLGEQDFESALGLLLSYGILKRSSGKTFSVDEGYLETLVEKNVQENANVFVKNEGLRNLLIHLTGYFPNIGKKLGVNKSFTVTDRFELKL